MKIYTVSGLGSNGLVFDRLEFPPEYQMTALPWVLPLDKETIVDYSQRLAEGIDEREDFIILGLSFGGILAQEVAKIKHPRKLFLFNTIKSNSEKPLWIKANKYLKLHKVFPYFILNNTPFVKYASKFLKILNPDRPDIDAAYTLRDRKYTQWAFEQITYWDNRDELPFEVYHFHGNLDLIFPIWNIRHPIRIRQGGHLAIYEKAKQINAILSNLLKN